MAVVNYDIIFIYLIIGQLDGYMFEGYLTLNSYGCFYEKYVLLIEIVIIIIDKTLIFLYDYSSLRLLYY